MQVFDREVIVAEQGAKAGASERVQPEGICAESRPGSVREAQRRRPRGARARATDGICALLGAAGPGDDLAMTWR